MDSVLLINGRIVLPETVESTSAVLIKSGLIAEISSAPGESENIIDLDGATLYPGFIDLHNHGAVTKDVNQSSENDLREISRFLFSKGVTSWMPTLVPDSDDAYRRVVEAIDLAMAFDDAEPISRIVGVHYEGVYANREMCGALKPHCFKTFGNKGEIELPRLKKGVHLTTLAPEIDNGIELIKKLVLDGWIVSIGHTSADTARLEASLNAGAKHATHFFNAMSGIHHRESGVAGWVLSNKEFTFDIIADGIHVAPDMLKLAVSHKNPDKVSLISDSISPTGLGDGEYEVWGEEISVVDRKTENCRGDLAGSVITLLDAVNMMRSLGFSEVDVAKMAADNPAKVLGLDKSLGTIDVGKRADFVAIDSEGNVCFTMVGGNYLSKPRP